MSELTPELVAEVVAACQTSAEEIAAALGGALDREFSLSIGEPTTYAAAAQDFDGAGLAVLIKFDGVGLAVILPESSGLLPPWCSNPDDDQNNKLSALAKELSTLALPEKLHANEYTTGQVEQITAALTAADVSNDAALVPLQLSSGDSTSQLSLIWPLEAPDSLLTQKRAGSNATNGSRAKPQSFSDLPGYSRSLLKIQVPVSVVLAAKKEKLGEVVELSPGSIIQFDKPCDELLNLCVGDQEVAKGEAVKIGDKFGFRVSAMQMPHEHFLKVLPNKLRRRR